MSTILVEELRGSLEAHELREIDRGAERKVDQALQAQTKGKFNKNNDWKKLSDNAKIEGKSESSNKVGGSTYNQGNKGTFDKRKIQCYRCDTYGHYARECWQEAKAKKS